MEILSLPILTESYANDINAFIDFWSRLYYYKLEEKYLSNITASVLDEGNIGELYFWKNGTILSDAKDKSLSDKIVSHLPLINQYREKKDFILTDFESDFKKVSAVWRFFLLHIINPKKYPIYDQHVHRAYCYMHGEPIKNINSDIKDIDKTEFYYKKYLPFVQSQQFPDLKKMDQAFFVFGQFLNTNRNRLLFSHELS